MILETGIDIIEVSRIRAAIERHGSRFLNRLFTKREQSYCELRAEPALHYAGRFAAKEAIYKALSAFGGELPLIELEVVNDERGRPAVALGPTLAERFANWKIALSISHCREYATAVAVCTQILE